MKVSNVIALACQFTENEDLIDCIESEEKSEEQVKKINLLLKCFNLVRSEVASDYFPILVREGVEVNNFKVLYKDLQNMPINIFSIKDEFGKSVRYKRFPEHMMIFARKVFITYSVLPVDLELNSEEVSSVLSERVYAYGVAREYYIMQSLTDEAEIWEERFKASLKSLYRRKSNTFMPSRRWI